jgi:hypothetical protein
MKLLDEVNVRHVNQGAHNGSLDLLDEVDCLVGMKLECVGPLEGISWQRAKVLDPIAALPRV